jgi:AcrR family transcriptional regulator
VARPKLVEDDQILTAMRRHVLAAGPHARLEDVAGELGVSVPAVLKRFGSREALMLAALKPPERPAWLPEVERGPDDRPLEPQLLEVLERLLGHFREVLPCMIALRESGIAPDKFISKEQPLAVLGALQTWLGAARDRGLVETPDLEAVAMAMAGAIQSRVFLSHLLQRETSAAAQRGYVAEVARLYARALAPGRRTSPRRRAP